jgi:hypothetical protein
MLFLRVEFEVLLLAASTKSGIPHVVDIILGLELASRQPKVVDLVVLGPRVVVPV